MRARWKAQPVPRDGFVTLLAASSSTGLPRGGCQSLPLLSGQKCTGLGKECRSVECLVPVALPVPCPCIRDCRPTRVARLAEWLPGTTTC